MSKPAKEFFCFTCGVKVKRLRKYCSSCYVERRKDFGKRLFEARKPNLAKIYTPQAIEYVAKNYNPYEMGSLAKVSKALKLAPETIQKMALKAGVPGVTEKKKVCRRWSAEDDAFIFENAFNKSWVWIGKQLGRTARAVYCRARRIGLDKEVRDYYTTTDVATVMGVDHSTVVYWIDNGWLRVFTVEGEVNTFYRTTEKEIIRFIMNHPTKFRLRNVDQFWFMDMLTDGGIMKQLLRAAGHADVQELTFDRIPARERLYVEAEVS